MVPPINPVGKPFCGLVSVVIPAHKCNGTLDTCLSSLTAQTYPHKQIIVVDDSPCPETKLAAQKHDVMYVPMTSRKGPGGARNEGAKRAKGAILVFGEADGYYESDYLEKLVRHMHLPGVMGAINLGRRVWTDRDTPIVRHQNDRFEAAANRVWQGRRSTGAWAFFADNFHDLGGYDPDCLVGEDMDLVRKLVNSGGKTVVGGFSLMHHKDPDTVKQYVRKSFALGCLSGRYRPEKKALPIPGKLLYMLKLAGLGLAPAYPILGIAVHPGFFVMFLFALGYLVLESRTTFCGWIYSLKRRDWATFVLTPVFLFLKRMALGAGRVCSFFPRRERSESVGWL